MTSSKWNTLLKQWSKDLQLWLYITATLQLFRLLLIATYHRQAGADSGASDVVAVLASGLRYDLSTAGTWIAPLILLSLLCVPLNRISLLAALRRISAIAYAIAGSAIFVVDMVFFGIYGDQLNQIIFGIYYDDTRAILSTLWKSYHPLLLFTLITLAAMGNIWLLGRWLAYDMRFIPRLSRGLSRYHAAVILLCLLLVTISVRGGRLWGEPIELKHAFVVDDLFLNRTVINPFSALHYTLNTRFQLSQHSSVPPFWPGKNIRDAVAVVCEMRSDAPCNTDSLDEALAMSARGHESIKPRHIFLLLMESHSGWTVMPQFRNAGLSPQLSGIAARGIYFPNIVSAGSGTIAALNTLVTGMPDIDLNINYAPASLTPYPSSLAVIMKRLGYKTRFFYGGYLSWQRLDIFAHSQGFDEVYGGGSMNAGKHGDVWGVNDKYLFDYVLQRVDDTTPSFNFILTTSNHPPYDLDLDALGYPVKQLPAPLEITKHDTIKIMGHLWYADQQAGRFIDIAANKFQQPLFAITGDHTAREQVKFPDDNVAEQIVVPFILYGPGVLHQAGLMSPAAGAHLDIPATLIELAADKGFVYTAYGQSLLQKTSPSYGFGWQYIIGENFIANINAPDNLYGLAMQPPPKAEDISRQVQQYQALKALSWYRVMKGALLPPQRAATIAVH